jgi:hypothetical protein
MPNLIGTAPDQVPVNGFLGNMAFQNKEGVVTDLLSTTALTVTGTASFAGTIAAGLGSAAAPSYTFIGDTNTGIFSPAADTIAFSEGGVEAMRITSAGLVGIGTTSPASKLHVESTSGAAGSAVARLTVTGTNGLEVGQEFFSTLVSGSTTALRSGRIYSKFDGSSYVSSRLSFQSMTTSNVLVDTMHLKNGSVGIGTSSPNTKLAVEGSACEISINDTAGTIAGLRFRTSGTTKGVIQADSTSNLRFSSGSTEAMRILSSGNVGIGTTTPAEKLSVAGAIRVHTNSSAGFTLDTKGGLFDFVPASNNVRVGYVPGTSGVNTGILTFVVGSGSEAMRIDSSGNVGIGTSSPAARVDLGYTGGTVALRISRDASNRLDFYQGGGVSYIDSSPASAQLAFATVGTEKMRINSSGNVGIGTTSPAAKLHVNESSGTQGRYGTRISQSGWTSAYGEFVVDTTNTKVDLNTSNGTYPLSFSIAGTEAVRITSAGNVGIGTSSPATKLDVNGAITSSGSANPYLALNNGTAISYVQVSSGALDVRVGGANPITFNTNSAERMRIDSSGNVGIGTTGPGVRLDVRHNQAANSFFDYYNTTFGGGVVWRQIVPNIANTGLTTVDIAKVAGGAFVINNNDTNAANFTAFGVGASERMRIDSSGNVGIGTSSPTARYRQQITAARGLLQTMFCRLTTSAERNSKRLLFSTQANAYAIRLTDAAQSYLGFLSSGTTERMRINSSGNVGIGTSSALATSCK